MSIHSQLRCRIGGITHNTESDLGSFNDLYSERYDGTYTYPKCSLLSKFELDDVFNFVFIQS